MEVINPFLQENKWRIIEFLDEISASTCEVIYHADYSENNVICFIDIEVDSNLLRLRLISSSFSWNIGDEVPPSLAVVGWILVVLCP